MKTSSFARKIVCWVIVSIILILQFVTPIVAFGLGYSDLTSEHWACGYIASMQYWKIVNGYPDGTFKPEKTLKVSEFLKMVSLALWDNYDYRTPEEGEHWAQPYVDSLGVKFRSTIYPDGVRVYTRDNPAGETNIEYLINPQDYSYEKLESEISREEAAIIIAKYFIILYSEKIKNGEIQIETITDSTESYINSLIDEKEITGSKNRYYLNCCVQFGIINGFEDGSFRPNDTLTRAQACKIIYTAMYYK